MDTDKAQLVDLAKKLHENTVQQATTNSILRSHINEQRTMNTRLERCNVDTELRVRSLEHWRERIETRIPASLPSGEQVKEKFAEIDRDITNIAVDVRGINKTIARWTGGIGLLVFLAQFIINWIFSS